MRKIMALSMLIIMLVCLTVQAVFSTNQVWLVSGGSGSDDNPGTPDGAVVDLPTRAFATVMKAVTEASNGDVIKVWPDAIYAEAVSTSGKKLTIMSGVPHQKILISPATGTPLIINSECTIIDVNTVCQGGTIAISVAAYNVRLLRCYGNGPTDGLYFSGAAGTFYNFYAKDCEFVSSWDAVNASGVDGFYWENVICRNTQSGSAQDSHAVQAIAGGIYKNCQFISKTSQTGSQNFGAIETTSSVLVILENPIIDISAPSGRTGMVYGIKNGQSGANIQTNGGIIRTAGSGASQLLDIQNSGTVQVNGTIYDPTKINGTIIDRQLAIQTKTDNLPVVDINDNAANQALIKRNTRHFNPCD